MSAICDVSRACGCRCRSSCSSRYRLFSLMSTATSSPTCASSNWRQISLPIEPPAPVTSTRRPRTVMRSVSANATGSRGSRSSGDRSLQQVGRAVVLEVDVGDRQDLDLHLEAGAEREQLAHLAGVEPGNRDQDVPDAMRAPRPAGSAARPPSTGLPGDDVAATSSGRRPGNRRPDTDARQSAAGRAPASRPRRRHR